MKILIAGGGTGGHLYPGIAIAREALKEQGSEVLFVGTEQGIEARVLPRENLPLRFISVGKLKGMSPAAMLRTMVTLPRSIGQSVGVLRSFRPDAVIGIGGYASGPVGLAARVLGIPLFIVEPNSYAGLANRRLGRMAARVLLTFPGSGSARFFPPGRTVLLGPLVRAGIDRGDRKAAYAAFGLEPGKFTVFVMGGSGGAHAINTAMGGAASFLAARHELQVLHQTGEKDVDEVRKSYSAAGQRAVVLPYIHDMAAAYAVADLVVGRSGATSVAELAVCGKRAVLVPFPHAADNHQEHNARTLAAEGRADVVVQKDLDPKRLAEMIIKHAAEGVSAPAGPGMANDAAAEIVRILRDHVQAH